MSDKSFPVHFSWHNVVRFSFYPIFSKLAGKQDMRQFLALVFKAVLTEVSDRCRLGQLVFCPTDRIRVCQIRFFSTS